MFTTPALTEQQCIYLTHRLPITVASFVDLLAAENAPQFVFTRHLFRMSSVLGYVVVFSTSTTMYSVSSMEDGMDGLMFIKDKIYHQV